MNTVLAALAVSGLLMSGCASSRSGTTFSRDEALRAQRTYFGVIETVKEGKIEGTKSPIGAIAGGVLGGVAGRTVGGGSGKDVATVGGALAGAAVGAIAEEAVTPEGIFAHGQAGRRTHHHCRAECRHGLCARAARKGAGDRCSRWRIQTE